MMVFKKGTHFHPGDAIGAANDKKFQHRHISDADFKARLIEKHKSIFDDQSVMKNRSEYQRKFTEYLLNSLEELGGGGCNGKNTIEEATDTHKKIFYDTSKSLRSGRQGGQNPGGIGFCNNSEDMYFAILNEGAWRSQDNKFVDATFGASINIRNKAHIDKTMDSAVAGYAFEHLLKKDPRAAYVFFEDYYGERTHAGGKSEKDEILLLEQRRAKFIKDLEQAGYRVVRQILSPDPAVEIMTSQGPRTLPIIIKLHNVTTCQVHVIQGENKVPFEEWASKAGLSENEVVRKHIESLRNHEANDKDFYEDFVLLMRWRKDVGCPDSRFFRINASVIRDFGAILDKDQRKRTLKTPGINVVQVDLHTKCGYVNETVGLHEVGMLFKRIFDQATADGKGELADSAREMLRQRLENGMFRGKWTNFDAELFKSKIAGMLDGKIPENISGFIDGALVPPKSPVQDALEHMYRSRFIVWNEVMGTCVMPSAVRLDRILENEGSPLHIYNRDSSDKQVSDAQRARYLEVLMMQIAKDQEGIWKGSVKKLMESGELSKEIKIKVRIEDFETGEVFYSDKNDLLVKRDALTNEVLGKYSIK